MNSNKNILNFTDPDKWRSWLDKNHADITEAWIVVQKKDSPVLGLSLDQAIEEALCYGWIDSTLNTKDDHSYLLRFSSRKPNSVWSISNIRRVNKLKEAGVMMPAGNIAVQAAKESGEWQAAIDRENPAYIPPELNIAFTRDPEAKQAYMKLNLSKKKSYIYWIQSAKKNETKIKRVNKILRLLNEEI